MMHLINARSIYICFGRLLFLFSIQYSKNNESYKVSDARENVGSLLRGSKLSYNKYRKITILKCCVN